MNLYPLATIALLIILSPLTTILGLWIWLGRLADLYGQRHHMTYKQRCDMGDSVFFSVFYFAVCPLAVYLVIADVFKDMVR